MLRLFKKKLPVHKANTVQVNEKLIIMDGHNPLRYIDLATNEVKMYKPKTKFTIHYKLRKND